VEVEGCGYEGRKGLLKSRKIRETDHSQSQGLGQIRGPGRGQVAVAN